MATGKQESIGEEPGRSRQANKKCYLRIDSEQLSDGQAGCSGDAGSDLGGGKTRT